MNKIDEFAELEKVTDVIQITKMSFPNSKQNLSQQNKRILKSWEDWFLSKSKPFVVIEKSTCFQLWKEDEIE